MSFVGPAAAAEAAAQSGAATQALQGFGGLQEFGVIGAAALAGSAPALLASSAIARSGLVNLGLAGPAYGLSAADAAFNAEYAAFVNALLGSLAFIGSTQALLALGTTAQLANSGRRYLLSTYFGV